MNTALMNHMIDRYNALSYTHEYIFGFFYKGNVYMVETDASVLPYILTLDKASRGQGYAIRFKPTTDQKLFLLSHGNTSLLCSKAFFEETTAESKYNKGEIFEKMVTESFGLKWEKDNIPFTDGGDIVVNHVAYQIKFDKATFTNEKFLARF
jgi:hypothetical protein